MSTLISFAERLQAVRKKLDLSQEQLAARLDVSFAPVTRWEAGKSKPQKAQMTAFERLWEEAGLDGDLSDPSTNGAANGARRRRGVQRSTVLGNKGMEQMLWDAACSIRGQQDAPKF